MILEGHLNLVVTKYMEMIHLYQYIMDIFGFISR